MFEIDLCPLLPSDQPFLWEMLYQALYVPPGKPLFSRAILDEPDIACYVQGWGRPGDWGWLAWAGETPAGAIWLRQWTGVEKGYGYVSPFIPELSIALLHEYRNMGLGTRMLEKVICKSFYSSSSLVNFYGLMDFSHDFPFYFIRPGINLRPARRLPDGLVFRVMTAQFGWQQFGDVAHDLVTDLIQLFSAYASRSCRHEWTERFADVDGHLCLLEAPQGREDLREPVQSDR